MKKMLIFGFVCLIVAVIIILYIFLPPRKLTVNDSREKEGSSSSLFSVVSEWKGTNGEVIRSLYIDSSNVYAAAGYDGLIVFDSNLNRLGGFVTNNPLYDVIIKTMASNKYAVATMGSYMGKGGLILLDVTDPSNIFATNVFENNDLSGNVFSSELAVSGNDQGIGEIIYTSDFNKGFQSYLIDWTNLIVRIGKSIAVPNSNSVDLVVCKTNAYLAAKEEGLLIMDIPGNRIIKQINPP